jgi:hypothetical protein
MQEAIKVRTHFVGSSAALATRVQRRGRPLATSLPPCPSPLLLPQPGDTAKDWQACGEAAAQYSLQSVLTSVVPVYKELASTSEYDISSSNTFKWVLLHTSD